MNKIIEIINILDAATNSDDIIVSYDATNILYEALYGPYGYLKTRDVNKLRQNLFTVTYPRRTFMDKIRGRNKNPTPDIELKQSHAETLRQLIKRGALTEKTLQFLQQKYDELAPAIAKARENKQMAALAQQAENIIQELNLNVGKLPTNIATHVTKYLPQNKNGAYYIPSTATASNDHSVRTTVHTFIDGIVTNYHGMGADWERMPYVIMAPLGDIIIQNGKPMIFNGEDTFWAVGPDGLRLPDNYRVARPAKNGELGDELYKILGTETIYKDTNFTDANIRTLLRGTSEYIRERWTHYSDIKNLSNGEKLAAQKSGIGPDEYIQQKRMELLHEMSRNNAAQQTTRFWYDHDLNHHSEEYFKDVAKKYDLKYGDKTAHSEILGHNVESIYQDFLYEIEKLTYLIQNPKTKLVTRQSTNGPEFEFNGHMESEFLPNLGNLDKHVLNMGIIERLWEFDNARDAAREIAAVAMAQFNVTASYADISPEQKQNIERTIQKMMRPLRMRFARFKMLRPKKQSLETFIKSRTKQIPQPIKYQSVR